MGLLAYKSHQILHRPSQKLGSFTRWRTAPSCGAQAAANENAWCWFAGCIMFVFLLFLQMFLYTHSRPEKTKPVTFNQLL